MQYSDLRNLVGTSRGFGCLVFLFVLAIAFVAWQTSAYEPSKMYIQHVTYRPNVGIAWCAGCPEVTEVVSAYYWYGCCNVCPPAHGDRIAVIRPNWQWSSDCSSNYNGHILVGNEDEFRGISPQQMANWLIAQRATFPKAIFICLNSHDINYMLDVIELLPSSTCEIYGVHTPANVQDVSGHLDQLCDDCAIWVTEMYGSNAISNAYQNMHDQVTQMLEDGRIKRIFVYTTTNAQDIDYNLLNTAGECLENCNGFNDAINAYP